MKPSLKNPTGKIKISLFAALVMVSAACQSALALMAGDRVIVNPALTVNSIAVRDNPAGNERSRASKSSQGSVLAGPENARLNAVDYEWWQVRFDSGASGWVAGRDADEYFLLRTLSVATTRIDSVTASSAAVYCDFRPENAPLGQHGVKYSTSPNLSNAQTAYAVSGTSGRFMCNLQNLTAGTKYYVQAFANVSVLNQPGTAEDKRSVTPWFVTKNAQSSAQKYELTVNAGTGGVVNNTSGVYRSHYEVGDIVALAAMPTAGYEFDRWTVSTGVLRAPEQSTLSFRMPAAAVTFTASFKKVVANDGRPIFQVPFEFGLTVGGYTYKDHSGGENALDFFRLDSGRSTSGLNVLASASGTIRRIDSKYNGNSSSQPNGCYIEIDHGNNWNTLYAHMKNDSIPSDFKVGTQIKTGQKLGVVGDTGQVTGAHLHYQQHIRFSFASHDYESQPIVFNGTIQAEYKYYEDYIKGNTNAVWYVTNTPRGGVDIGDIINLDDPYENYAVAGLAPQGVKLTAPKTLTVPKGVKLAKGTKALYVWRDAGGGILQSSTKKTLTVKNSGDISVTLEYTRADSGDTVSVPHSFGVVKIFAKPALSNSGKLTVAQTTDTITNSALRGTSVVSGEALTLTAGVVTSGGGADGPFNYIWYRGKSVVRQEQNTYATSDTLTTPAFGDKADSYKCVVEIAAKDAKGKPLATAKSKDLKAKIILPPSAVTLKLSANPVKENGALTLSASAKGTSALIFTWYKNGAQIATGSAKKFAKKPVAVSDAGTYYVVVSQDKTTRRAQSATLSVSVQRADGSVVSGAQSRFALLASPAAGQRRQDAAATANNSAAANNSVGGVLNLAPLTLGAGDVLTLSGTTTREYLILNETRHSAGAYRYEWRDSLTAEFRDVDAEAQLTLRFTTVDGGVYELTVSGTASETGVFELRKK